MLGGVSLPVHAFLMRGGYFENSSRADFLVELQRRQL
jgi:hypothetical protein